MCIHTHHTHAYTHTAKQTENPPTTHTCTHIHTHTVKQTENPPTTHMHTQACVYVCVHTVIGVFECIT